MNLVYELVFESKKKSHPFCSLPLETGKKINKGSIEARLIKEITFNFSK